MKQQHTQNIPSEKKAALDLFSSLRGRYIIGQALSLARQSLKETEPSNAADMELLGRNLFSPFFDLHEAGILTSATPNPRS